MTLLINRVVFHMKFNFKLFLVLHWIISIMQKNRKYHIQCFSKFCFISKSDHIPSIDNQFYQFIHEVEIYSSFKIMLHSCEVILSTTSKWRTWMEKIKKIRLMVLDFEWNPEDTFFHIIHIQYIPIFHWAIFFHFQILHTMELFFQNNMAFSLQLFASCL